MVAKDDIDSWEDELEDVRQRIAEIVIDGESPEDAEELGELQFREAELEDYITDAELHKND